MIFFTFFIFREEGSRGRESKREKHKCERETLISCLLDTPQQIKPRMCPDPELNWCPSGAQDSA